MNEIGRVDDIGEVLWRRHAAELLRYATLLTGAADADDIVSAVFLRATASGRHPDNMRAYLFRAVLNEALDQRRSSRRRRLRDRHAILRSPIDPPEANEDVSAAITAAITEVVDTDTGQFIEIQINPYQYTSGIRLGTASMPPNWYTGAQFLDY